MFAVRGVSRTASSEAGGPAPGNSSADRSGWRFALHRPAVIGHVRTMMLLLLVGIAAGLYIIERRWPANDLPRVTNWWGRVIFVNVVQIGIVIAAGLTWERWLQEAAIFRLRDHSGTVSQGFVAYFISTFIYYWWHRWRHESALFWRLCHQLHHSPQRIELLTSFYKHPVEITLNSLISAGLVYLVLGCSVSPRSRNTFITSTCARRAGSAICSSAPSRTACTTSSDTTPRISPTCRCGTRCSAPFTIQRSHRPVAVTTNGARTDSKTSWSSATSTPPARNSDHRCGSFPRALAAASAGHARPRIGPSDCPANVGSGPTQ